MTRTLLVRVTVTPQTPDDVQQVGKLTSEDLLSKIVTLTNQVETTLHVVSDSTNP